MVNPLDFVPKLSGFSPMPLGIMAPFMGYQSAALAYNFGLNYEFGKRVIKSMSNDKFNEIANDPILLNELTSRHHDVLLKAFINEVPKVDKIQDLIIKKMVELEFAKIKVMPELIAQIPKGFLEGIFALGQTGETVTPPSTPPPPAKKGKSSTFKDKDKEKITIITRTFAEANATGRVSLRNVKNASQGAGKYALFVNFNGWSKVHNVADFHIGVKDGNASYPKYSNKNCTHSVKECPGFNQYQFPNGPKHKYAYWISRAKIFNLNK